MHSQTCQPQPGQASTQRADSSGPQREGAETTNRDESVHAHLQCQLTSRVPRLPPSVPCFPSTVCLVLPCFQNRCHVSPSRKRTCWLQQLSSTLINDSQTPKCRPIHFRLKIAPKGHLHLVRSKNTRGPALGIFKWPHCCQLLSQVL